MEEKTIITSSTASERPLETLSRAGERIIPITILSSRQEQVNYRIAGLNCAINTLFTYRLILFCTVCLFMKWNAYVQEGGNEGSVSIFDSFYMKKLWFKFGHDAYLMRIAIDVQMLLVYQSYNWFVLDLRHRHNDENDNNANMASIDSKLEEWWQSIQLSFLIK